MDFKIEIDLSALLEVSPMVEAGIFASLSAAVERVTIAGAERWREAVLKAPLWDGERQAYAATIQHKMLGPYSGEIVSDYKYVEDIETGRPARDLKKMLDTSSKVRISAKGRRYLIIPMRHNTPGNAALAGAMPQEIYDQASQLAPSRVIGQTTRPSGLQASDIKTKTHLTVNQNVYKWGGRLPAGLAPKLKPSHTTDIYSGMVKFATPSGAKNSSTYLSFRVMSDAQVGKWIIPPQPGLYIAKKVAEDLQGDAERIFSEAVKFDLSGAG